MKTREREQRKELVLHVLRNALQEMDEGDDVELLTDVLDALYQGCADKSNAIHAIGDPGDRQRARMWDRMLSRVSLALDEIRDERDDRGKTVRLRLAASKMPGVNSGIGGMF